MVVPSRDEGGSFFSKGQGGQSKRKIARDRAGHCKSKSVQGGVGQQGGKMGIPPDLGHINPKSAAAFALSGVIPGRLLCILG